MHCSHSAREAISCPAGFSVLFDVLTSVLILCPSSLVSFFISTTNKGSCSGHCFSSAPLPRWALLHGYTPVSHATLPVTRKIWWRPGFVRKRDNLGSTGCQPVAFGGSPNDLD